MEIDKKELMRNPDFYFILIPSVALLIFVHITFIKLIGAKKEYDSTSQQYKLIQERGVELIALDPERLAFGSTVGKDENFDYMAVLNRYAAKNSIQCKKSTGRVINSKGTKTQTADVSIESAGLIDVMGFLTEMLSAWPDLSCELITINGLKDVRDKWRISLDFKYEFN